MSLTPSPGWCDFGVSSEKKKGKVFSFFCFFSPNSGYTEGVLSVRVKAGFDQGTRSDLVVSSAQECRFEILC